MQTSDRFLAINLNYFETESLTQSLLNKEKDMFETNLTYCSYFDRRKMEGAYSYCRNLQDKYP